MKFLVWNKEFVFWEVGKYKKVFFVEFKKLSDFLEIWEWNNIICGFVGLINLLKCKKMFIYVGVFDF